MAVGFYEYYSKYVHHISRVRKWQFVYHPQDIQEEIVMHNSRVVLAAAGLIALGWLVPLQAAAGQGNGSPDKSIVQVAREAGSFSTLIRAIQAADLVGTLSGQGKGPFTVFAPTDEAFAKIDPATLQLLLGNPEALRQILLYHVVPGEYPASRVVTSASLPTANGQDLTISTTGGVQVNGANVTATDITARNGIIHVIDTVLLP
jgi:uncharacterized surface protein with fasciclin (FAS1) repeats